jgi:hypothetical protein
VQPPFPGGISFFLSKHDSQAVFSVFVPYNGHCSAVFAESKMPNWQKSITETHRILMCASVSSLGGLPHGSILASLNGRIPVSLNGSIPASLKE